MTTNATSKGRPRMGTIMNIGCARSPHILPFDPGERCLDSLEELWQ